MMITTAMTMLSLRLKKMKMMKMLKVKKGKKLQRRVERKDKIAMKKTKPLRKEEIRMKMRTTLR